MATLECRLTARPQAVNLVIGVRIPAFQLTVDSGEGFLLPPKEQVVDLVRPGLPVGLIAGLATVVSAVSTRAFQAFGRGSNPLGRS